MTRDRIARTHVSTAAALLCLCALPAWAQGAFEKEVGTDAAALTEQVKLSMMNGDGDGAENGRGPRPYLKALGGPPKRVALISFYVWDCGNKKENLYNPVWRYKRTENVTAEGIDAFANEFHDAAIGGMKEAFAAHGMQLLTPDEFLDSAEKRATYENFEVEIGAGQKFARWTERTTADKWRNTGLAEGYREFHLGTINDVKGNHFTLGATGIGVGKLAQSLGHDLATALGVDAVTILYNVVQGEKKSITLLGSYMYMFGPNPVADTGQSLYWSGHQYSGVYLRTNVPFIVTDKDGKLVSSDYAGYGVVGRALAARMGQHVQDKVTGAKSGA